MNKDDAVAIIRSLLSSTNSSYSIYKLNNDFKNETGINIPLFGYKNLGDFLSSLPETVKVTGIHPIQRVSLITNQKSGHIVSLVKRQKSNGRKKLSKSKAFIKTTATDTRFEDIQSTQTVLEKKEFSGLKQQNEDFRDKSVLNVKEMPPMDLDLTLSLGSTKRLIPLKYFCCTGEIIPPIDMELHARVGEYVEVCPCQIFSPHKFYFHLRKFKKKFENFFEELQIFYSTHEIPVMKKELIRPKQIGAVFYKIFVNPQWHRVEIKKIICDCRIIVNFIDFGCTAIISVENLKLLHLSFISFPRQAILGVLANIKPVKGESKWSHCATKRFYDLAFRKALVAGVVEVDTKTCCMKLALSCTKNLEIHINDTLVKEGYAEFDANVLDNRFTDTFKITQSCAKNFNFFEFEPHEDMKNNERLTRRYLNLVQNSQIHRTPIYFPNDDNNNNCRLKKMFSRVNEE